MEIDVSEEAADKIKKLEKQIKSLKAKVTRLEEKRWKDDELRKYSKEIRGRLDEAARDMIDALSESYWQDFLY